MTASIDTVPHGGYGVRTRKRYGAVSSVSTHKLPRSANVLSRVTATVSSSITSPARRDHRASCSCTVSKDPRGRITWVAFFPGRTCADGARVCSCFVGADPNPTCRAGFITPGRPTISHSYLRSSARAGPESPWFAVGVSLGGNVLLKWLGESGAAVATRIRAAATISVPFDLEAGARHIARGFARVYDRSFLRSLRRKAAAKLARYPDLFDRDQLARAKTVYDFDDAVTAPVHGFANAHDYYTKSSSLQYLSKIRVPTLLLSSSDDPFLPPQVLERARHAAATNPALTVEFHEAGGHVGFVAGLWPWRPVYYAEQRVFRFFEEAMERR